MTKTKNGSNRDELVTVLAKRQGMTVEDWVWSLQERELQKMKAEDAEGYIQLLEEIAFRPDSHQDKRRTPPPKTCDTCALEKHPNQYRRGGSTCKACRAASAREGEAQPSAQDEEDEDEEEEDEEAPGFTVKIDPVEEMRDCVRCGENKPAGQFSVVARNCCTDCMAAAIEMTDQKLAEKSGGGKVIPFPVGRIRRGE